MSGDHADHPKNIAREIPLEQLIVLNDEIVALIRAGVPLERGLIEFGREMPGRVGDTALRLGERIQAGESLETILSKNESSLSPIWRAVVAAGLRAGQLAAALEGLSTTARRVSEMRQAFCAALVYPLVVVTLAFLLFVFTVTCVAPAIANAYIDLTASEEPLTTALARLGLSARWWAIGVPLIAAAGFGLWWRHARQSDGRTSEDGRDSLWRCLSVRQVRRDGQMATFTEVLALLVRQQVPMTESLVLAGAASGNGQLQRAAEVMAARLRAGELFLTPQDARSLRFPPLLAWLIAAGSQEVDLAAALSSTAARYRERAARGVMLSRLGWPLVATAFVGGAVTLLQGLVVFAPISRLLFALTLENP